MALEIISLAVCTLLHNSYILHEQVTGSDALALVFDAPRHRRELLC